MSLFAKITRAATVILTLACLPNYAVAQQMTVVPPGNRSAEQPEIPRASAIRTKAFYTTYEEKFRKTIDLLNSEPALVGKIKKAAAAYGIDPIHFGLVLVLTGGLGLVTPPVGSVLFIGTAIGKISVGESMKTIWPFWMAGLLVLLIVTFFPELSLWLPALLRS